VMYYVCINFLIVIPKPLINSIEKFNTFCYLVFA